MNQTQRLILVYNAKGGLFHMVADAVHKMVSPATYPCSLCAISYGPVAMHGAWKDALARFPGEVEFFHSDDFPAAYPAVQPRLPAILMAEGSGEPCVLIGAEELDSLPSLEALIALLDQRRADRAITPSSE